MDTEFAKAIAEQVELSQSIISDLETQLADLQKVAAVKPVFNDEAVEAALSKLVEANLIPSNQKEAFAARIGQDPAILLAMLKSAAETKINEVPRLGVVDGTAAPVEVVKESEQMWNQRFGK